MRIDPQKLRRAREDHGWTQTQLGLRAGFGTDAAAVKVVQRGELKGALSAASIRRLAKVLGKPVEFFIATTATKEAAPIQRQTDDTVEVINPEAMLSGDVAGGDRRTADNIYSVLEADLDNDPENARVRIHHARALLERTDCDPRERVQRAIDLLEGAIELAQEMTSDWALAEQWLAKAWVSHPNPEGVDRLSKATKAITEAMRFYAEHKRSMPEKIAWVQCLNDLAVIMAQSPVEQTRRQAVIRFQRVAKFHDLAGDKHRWAVTMRNLGNTWATLSGQSDRERRGSLTKSIEAYRLALKFHTRRAHTLEYARISYSMANSLLEYALVTSRGEARRQAFSNAFAAIRQESGGALSVLTRKDNPVDWANAHFNLAMIYHKRADPAADDLKRAIGHYGKVLGVFTREVSESEYALTLLPMAQAKEALAEISEQDSPQLLREAIAHMKAVQHVFPADPVHRRSLERLRKKYLSVRRANDPAYSNINPGLI